MTENVFRPGLICVGWSGVIRLGFEILQGRSPYCANDSVYSEAMSCCNLVWKISALILFAREVKMRF